MDGYVQLYTNDAQYYNYNFLVAYNDTYAATYLTSSTVLEITAMKKSGAVGPGYGVAFGYQDSMNFYNIFIAIDGTYNVYKRVNGSYIQIQDWTSSSALLTGYDQANVIKVLYTGTGTYDVYFNGVKVTTITDTAFVGGKAGFSVYIGSSANENFPGTPEDCRFKMAQPVSIP